jgi:hypothetical protein
MKAFAVAAIPDQDLSSGNLYVIVDGTEKRVQDLHPEDASFGRRDAKQVLREHPEAFFRLRVKPGDVWQPPAGEVRQSLEGFLGQRLPGLYQGAAAPGRLTAWGWVAVVGSALNAVGLLFTPLADSSTLATLHSLGGQTTALTRLLATRWFSPALAVLTVACLVEAFRVPARRRLWIGASYLPVTIGFAAALFASYSAYFSILGSIR